MKILMIIFLITGIMYFVTEVLSWIATFIHNILEHEK